MVYEKSESDYKKMFTELDNDQDGLITEDEIREFVEKRGESSKYLHQLFEQYDTDEDDMINYKEFVLVERKRYFMISFNELDENGDRFVTEEELTEFLSLVCSAEEIHQIFMDADTNGDGFISFEEYSNTVTNEEAISRRNSQFNSQH